SSFMQKPLRNISTGMLRFSWQIRTSMRSSWLWMTQPSASTSPAKPNSPNNPISARISFLPANGDDSTPNRLSLNSRNAHHGAMLNDIPTHLIAGPLGAGKTSLIRALLAQKPAGERWAVLINEFGQVGLDAALL